MENNAAVKRPLDEGVESNAKRSKTADDLQMLLPIEDIRNIRDPRKRKQLPFVVYELLKLFKQSENVYSEVDEKVVSMIADHMVNDIFVRHFSESGGGGGLLPSLKMHGAPRLVHTNIGI